jgi:hypothetical protein
MKKSRPRGKRGNQRLLVGRRCLDNAKEKSSSRYKNNFSGRDNETLERVHTRKKKKKQKKRRIDTKEKDAIGQGADDLIT